VIGSRHAQILTQFPIDVHERRWLPYALADGEGQAVRLASAVVRILAEDHHLRLGARRETQRGENLVVRWVNAVTATFGLDEPLELGPVRFLELMLEQWIPVGAE